MKKLSKEEKAARAKLRQEERELLATKFPNVILKEPTDSGWVQVVMEEGSAELMLKLRAKGPVNWQNEFSAYNRSGNIKKFHIRFSLETGIKFARALTARINDRIQEMNALAQSSGLQPLEPIAQDLTVPKPPAASYH